MRVSAFNRYALGASVAGAILSSCASQTQNYSPSSIGALPKSSETRGAHSSQRIPDKAKGLNLLYTAEGNNVLVYTYPNGKLLGSLGVGGLYLCTDRKNNVFIPAGNFGTQILVYAHGATTPTVTLNDPYPAVDCSVAPESETLAVTDSIGGRVVVYPYNKKPVRRRHRSP